MNWPLCKLFFTRQAMNRNMSFISILISIQRRFNMKGIFLLSLVSYIFQTLTLFFFVVSTCKFKFA